VVDAVLTRRGVRQVRRALKRVDDVFLEFDADLLDGRSPSTDGSRGVVIERR